MDGKRIHSLNFTKIEIQLIRFIFKHYKEKLNARQIAKVMGLNHAHLTKLCNLLVAKNLLKKEELGNAAYFEFNYNDKLAQKFMDYLLSLEEAPSWLAVAVYELKKLVPFLELGLVFGSSIKSKNHNDIDVLLVYKPEKTREIQKIKDVVRKSELIEKPIRYLELTEKDLYLNKEDKILYNALAENLIFHNPEKYIEVIQKCRKLKST